MQISADQLRLFFLFKNIFLLIPGFLPKYINNPTSIIVVFK
jgi:hypothetical protein